MHGKNPPVDRNSIGAGSRCVQGNGPRSDALGDALIGAELDLNVGRMNQNGELLERTAIGQRPEMSFQLGEFRLAGVALVAR